MSKTNFIYNPISKGLIGLLMAGAGGFVLTACGPRMESGLHGDAVDSAIVNGEDVPTGDAVAKSVVALVSRSEEGQALCTGSIIAKDTILTAAHCVDRDPSRLLIVFAPELKGVSRSQVREATNYVQNPKWSHGSTSAARTQDGRGDLALIHFEGGLPTGYKPVKVVPKTWLPDKGVEVLEAGYGVTNGLRSTGSGRLRETSTTIVGLASDSEVVTDGKKSSVCFGDSGGPAFVRKGKVLEQWGVASAVTSQACNKQAIHTSIAPYAEWIKSAAARMRR